MVRRTLLAFILCGSWGYTQEPCCVLGLDKEAPDPAKLHKQRCPRPKRFALVFSFGYAGDLMPKEDDRFDTLLAKIKVAGFNTIHCPYSRGRLALCKKRGVQMMIDLLAPEAHVYNSPDKAKALCEKLRGDPDVWGYNIWNDPIRKTTPGRIRDIDNVRLWDPTHPAFCGTYRTDGMRTLDNPDAFGYYDFHWKRGLAQHFPHLVTFAGWARERNAWFYSWLSVTSGAPGKGNYNRCLWSANTAIAAGQKGILWFLATDMMDKKTLEWTQIGQDIARVHDAIAPLADELAQLESIALYATPVTKSPNNEPLAREAMPAGLERNVAPRDFWAQPLSGEVLLGVFKDRGGRDALYIANHNAYAEQEVKLKLGPERRASLFQHGKWTPAEMKDGVLRLPLPPAAAALLRLEK
mgnify:CR=1 FL=1